MDFVYGFGDRSRLILVSAPLCVGLWYRGSVFFWLHLDSGCGFAFVGVQARQILLRRFFCWFHLHVLMLHKCLYHHQVDLSGHCVLFDYHNSELNGLREALQCYCHTTPDSMRFCASNHVSEFPSFEVYTFSSIRCSTGVVKFMLVGRKLMHQYWLDIYCLLQTKKFLYLFASDQIHTFWTSTQI